MEMNSLFKTGPKIVFIDLDDTLLNDDKMVSDENKYALQDWLEAGILFLGKPKGFCFSENLTV